MSTRMLIPKVLCTNCVVDKYSTFSNVFSAGHMYFDILRNIINQCYKVCIVDFKYIVLKPPYIDQQKLPLQHSKQKIKN
jgi:hypothetical protein